MLGWSGNNKWVLAVLLVYVLAKRKGVTHGGSGKHQDQLSEQQIGTYWKVSPPYDIVNGSSIPHRNIQIILLVDWELIVRPLKGSVCTYHYMACHSNGHQTINPLILSSALRRKIVPHPGIHYYDYCMSMVHRASCC